MSFEITTQHLVNAWIDAVIDEIKTFEHMDDMCRDEGDGKWFARAGTPLWGSYWIIRKLTGALRYSESAHVELAMDRFLNQYCEAIKQANETNDEESA